MTRTDGAAAAADRLRRRLAPLAVRLTATPLIPVVIAVVLGLFRAAEKSVWLDEAVAVAIARRPTLDMLVFLWRSELHASPYYVALHPWLALGDSELAIRALSVVFGVVAVLATWAVGRRYGVAFGAALILAVTPVFVQYEQEARGYTLLMATSAIATLLFLRLVERPGRWRAAAYVVVATGLIYVHPLGALVVVAHALAVLTLVARPLRWRLLALYVPVVVGWLPLVRFALSHRDRIDWIQPTTVDLATTELLALGGGLVVGAVLLLALALGMRRDVIALWLVLPIAGTLAMSLIVQPLFEMRYLLSAVPAAAVIAARNRWWLVAVLVGVSLVGAWNWYGDTDAKDDWRSATAWVATAIQPGDGIVFAPHYLRVPFGYHARIGEPLWAPVPWSASDLFTTPPDAELVRAHRRIWLVEGHVVDLPPEITAALAGFRPAEQRSYAGPNGLRVTLLVAGALP